MPATFTPADWQARVERVVANRRGQPVRFIQIGAMDGVQFDPLHTHIIKGGWQGAFIEPMPFHMKSLQEAYKGLPHLHFIQAAVVAENGPINMTYLPPETVQHYNIKGCAVGMGCVDYNRSGFAKQTAEAQTMLKPLMAEITVDGMTLQSALQQANIEALDIYVSDTEGYDAIILQQLDMQKYRPELILIEHEHLSQQEKIDAIVRLRPLGYREYFAKDNSEDLLFVHTHPQ